MKRQYNKPVLEETKMMINPLMLEISGEVDPGSEDAKEGNPDLWDDDDDAIWQRGYNVWDE